MNTPKEDLTSCLGIIDDARETLSEILTTAPLTGQLKADANEAVSDLRTVRDKLEGVSKHISN